MGEVDQAKVRRIVAWRVFLASLPVMAILAACYAGALLAAKAYDLPRSIALLMAAIAVLLLMPVYMKVVDVRYKRQMSGLRGAMDHFAPMPASEAEFAWLDLDSLKTWTFHLGSLRFAKLTDCTIATGAAEMAGIKTHVPFTRLMVSHESNCFAEVSQSCRPGEGPGKMTLTLVTVYSSGDDCRTTTGEVQQNEWTAEVMKNTFPAPVDSASELLRIHLEQRDRIAREQSLDIVKDLSYDVFVAQLQRQLTRTRELCRRIMASHGVDMQ